MRHVRFAFLFLLFFARAARAETDREAGERLYEEGRAAEVKLEFAAAVHAYDASLARDPSGRWALAARARADDLHAHSEGGFGPLTTLERVRRGPQTNETLDALLRDADGFPPGPVRGEARMLAAEVFLASLRRPADGKRALGLVLDDASADPALRRFAARRLADLAIAEGRTADARSAAARADDPFLEKRVTRAIRRGVARKLSALVLGGVVLFTFVAIVRAWRRGELGRMGRALGARHRVIALLSAVVASGGAIATLYENGHALPFIGLGVAIGLIASAALAWSSVGSTAPWARAGRALLCAAAVVGAGFLVLDRIDASYLESFGL